MVRNRPPIDLIARIQTPENIEFEYRLAGPFRRLPAYALDILIRIAVLFLLWIVVVIFGSVLSLGGLNLSLDLAIFLFMVFQFVLQWFYGAFFEAYWNGQTPGKWFFGIRVISVDGRPINANQAIVRNLVRTADMIPTGIVGLLCATLTERFQRLGDLAAGTMVVLNDVSWVPTNIQFEDARVAALSEYIPPNFRLTSTMAKSIALFAERRARIPMSRRLELASYIARPLMKRFGFREDTSPDLLLCAIYYREFIIKDAFRADSVRARSPVPIGASPMATTASMSNQVPVVTSSLDSRAPSIGSLTSMETPPMIAPPNGLGLKP